MDYLSDLLGGYWEHVVDTFRFWLNPKNRLFILYILSSVFLAYLIYRKVKNSPAPAGSEESRRSFLRFLFPREVWSHPSAWLDLRYFFFHQLIGHFIFIGLSAWAMTGVFSLVTGGIGLSEAYKAGSADAVGGAAGLALAVVYMFVALAFVDLVAYTIHYFQHKIPVLWEFHKVHHSAEVMHPMSNFREHPIDNFVYILLIGAGYGVVTGAAYSLLGYLPQMPAVLGVPLLMLAFNLVGYNLRHSHIWLRWPGRWAMIFPSPAHHHVHHSCHPEHIDKNFAFMFPIWDVIFGTYELPESNEKVKFGVDDPDAAKMDTCLKLYLIPFGKAYRLIRKAFDRTPEASRAIESRRSEL